LVAQDVEALEARRAARGDDVAAQNLERRRLARAVDAQEAKDLARGHAEGEVAHRGLCAAVDLAQRVDDDGVALGAAGAHAARLGGHVVVVGRARRRAEVAVGPHARAQRGEGEPDVDGDGERRVAHGLGEEVEQRPARGGEREGREGLRKLRRGRERAAARLGENELLEDGQLLQPVAERVAGQQAVHEAQRRVRRARRRNRLHHEGREQQN
jgi:hypothetical protein